MVVFMLGMCKLFLSVCIRLTFLISNLYALFLLEKYLFLRRFRFTLFLDFQMWLRFFRTLSIDNNRTTSNLAWNVGTNNSSSTKSAFCCTWFKTIVLVRTLSLGNSFHLEPFPYWNNHWLYFLRQPFAVRITFTVKTSIVSIPFFFSAKIVIIRTFWRKTNLFVAASSMVVFQLLLPAFTIERFHVHPRNPTKTPVSALVMNRTHWTDKLFMHNWRSMDSLVSCKLEFEWYFVPYSQCLSKNKQQLQCVKCSRTWIIIIFIWQHFLFVEAHICTWK